MALTLFYVLFIVVGLRFFSPSEVGLSLLSVAFLYVLYRLFKKDTFKELLLPLAAFFAGIFVYVSEDATVFQAVPILISSAFFLKFAEAYFFKKPFLGALVSKTPKVNLTEKKIEYINSSHGYWTLVNAINVTLQTVVLFAPIHVWALYTTLGWYTLFAVALGSQIIYGKLNGI